MPNSAIKKAMPCCVFTSCCVVISFGYVSYVTSGLFKLTSTFELPYTYWQGQVKAVQLRSSSEKMELLL